MCMFVRCIKQSRVHIPRCLLSGVAVLDSLRFVLDMDILKPMSGLHPGNMMRVTFLAWDAF